MVYIEVFGLDAPATNLMTIQDAVDILRPSKVVRLFNVKDAATTITVTNDQGSTNVKVYNVADFASGAITATNSPSANSD